MLKILAAFGISYIQVKNSMSTHIYLIWFFTCLLVSGRTDNRYVSVSADISVIGRYIGLADKVNAYRYRLSVSVIGIGR